MNLTEKELKALKTIRNYLAHNGKMPSVRDLMKEMGYKYPRSASFLINQLVEKEALRKINKKIQLPDNKKRRNITTVNVPLVGSVSCGKPIESEENIEAYIPISTEFAKPGHKYFLLRADGDSMNEAGINDGDYILARQQIDADNGEQVVALVDNESTVKELHRDKGFVSLVPRSSNPKHKPIILDTDTSIQGVVVKSIPKSVINH